VAAWTTGVAYLSASMFYQIATYHKHPESSMAWITALLTTLVVVIVSLRIWSTRGQQRVRRVRV
jgi:ferrous iron transport protein B